MTTEVVERDGAAISWVPPGELTYETWVELGGRIGREAQRFQWISGDWINYGADRWGEKFAEALAVTGIEYSTLRSYASVAARIENVRRRTNLSFGHHEAVVALDPDAQDRILDHAEAEGLSVAALRSHLRGLEPPTDPTAPSEWATISLRVPRELEPTWDAARDAVVQREGIKLHEDTAIARGQVLEVLLASYLASA